MLSFRNLAPRPPWARVPASLDGQHFHSVNFPTSDNAPPPVNQLLGVNDSEVAAGFYTDGQGNNHGYTYSIRHNSFTAGQRLPGRR